jgi:hypothetical protein
MSNQALKHRRTGGIRRRTFHLKVVSRSLASTTRPLPRLLALFSPRRRAPNVEQRAFAAPFAHGLNQGLLLEGEDTDTL